MLRKIGRLFIIKTRFEAWVVIYAIALGATARGQHYLVEYPGYAGWMLAAACTGVVFLAGAKLLDSIQRPVPATVAGRYAPPRRTDLIRRNRPRRPLAGRASARRTSRRTD